MEFHISYSYKIKQKHYTYLYACKVTYLKEFLLEFKLSHQASELIFSAK